MKTYDFLLEIGVEEVPDWMIESALAALKDRFFNALGQQLPDWRVDATPRRLVLLVRGVPEKEADTKETVTGPSVSAGLGAAQGFARKMGVAVEKLKKVQTPKGEYFSHTRKNKGRRTIDVLAQALPGVILGIPWPKTMTWTGKAGARFIRPIRWMVALYGKKVVPFEIAGVKADRFTHGHRRLAQPGQKPRKIRVADFESLKEGLRRNFVLLDATDRRKRIGETVTSLLGDGLNLAANPNLLETLVNITEYPTPIIGSFDPEYLKLPWEVLTTVMEHHQKYFAVRDAATGEMAPHFIAVMNIDADPEGIVRHGHERVLRARFNDARFFWQTDQKKSLANRVEDLKHVTFHAKLGSYYDKTERNIELVKKLGGDEHAQRAALLAKCDLTTDLVKEFTELQGVVGGLYARAQGEPAEVADSIYDQYDAVPRSRTGQIVALADRLDTLGGFFRLGLAPSGSRDPFALRRAALGIVRILMEGPHEYLIGDLLDWAYAGETVSIESRIALREFLLERARHYFQDLKGLAYDEVNAVLAAGAEDLNDVANRLVALDRVRPTENFEPLATSFKRIKNILRQAGALDAVGSCDQSMIEAGPEQDLYDEFEDLRLRVATLQGQLNYEEALAAIASLRPKVDAFFDHVLVNDPDPKIRANRLNFLAQLLREFSTIADFSEIVIAGG